MQIQRVLPLPPHARDAINSLARKPSVFAGLARLDCNLPVALVARANHAMERLKWR
ncbi:hypothetical protein IM53_012230 [Xanthomonas phaseoli pv. dieffenbachiae]|uniref:Uncharacterized protein n=1 Tax=Xanthomonas phaseoli pv. dieffenbachiae TaxID=92828 RepID=A0A1V9H654_9XANT|nr:hypothetical protein IM53_012230 [Xanthomonas phaseoli pv. dieffenbachiae]